MKNFVWNPRELLHGSRITILAAKYQSVHVSQMQKCNLHLGIGHTKELSDAVQSFDPDKMLLLKISFGSKRWKNTKPDLLVQPSARNCAKLGFRGVV